MVKGNISSITGGGKPNMYKEAIRDITANFDLVMEFNNLNAKVLHGRFVALVEEGFTAEQALFLIK